MKKIFTVSLALTTLIFSASAQERREMKTKQPVSAQQHKMKGDKNDMITNINLTEAQKVQLKAEREAYKQKISQLKSQNLSEGQYQEQVKMLHAEQRAKMQAILTPEQKAQMAQIKSANDERGKFEDDKRKARKNKGNLKEKLAISDDQAEKLKAQHEALKIKKEAIKNDPALSQEQKKEKMKALMIEAKQERSIILTPGQAQIMEDLKKDHKSKNSRKVKK
ncbi:MAG: hypothetical protein ABIP80_06480 [Ferruginibacter sp.]